MSIVIHSNEILSSMEKYYILLEIENLSIGFLYPSNRIFSTED